MIVVCEKCKAKYDDQFRWTYCPHDTFEANDGQNNFAHHPDSFLQSENEQLIDRVGKLLMLVQFEGYRFMVRESHGGVFLRGSYMEADVYTKVVQEQLTRKWLLAPQMTDSEIVATVFKCCWTSFEHRCREAFMYKGKRIFGPHFDVDDLAKLCIERENAGARPAALDSPDYYDRTRAGHVESPHKHFAPGGGRFEP